MYSQINSENKYDIAGSSGFREKLMLLTNLIGLTTNSISFKI